jgi:DNA polymerase-3 subunit beta
MLIITQKSALTAALKSVARVVEHRNSVEIFGYVHLCVEGDALKITGTDLDIYESARVPADVGDAGAVCVPAHLFAKLAAQLPDVPVTLETAIINDLPRLVVSAGRSSFELATRPVEDFPREAMKRAGCFELPAATLRRMLEKTRYAISTEEVRFYLNGVLFDTNKRDGILTAVACDGHRLCNVELPLPDGADVLAKLEQHIIVPRKTCLELLKAFAKTDSAVTVTCAKLADTAAPRLIFAAGDIEIVTKIIDGTFPDYQRVIPMATAGDVMRVKRGDLEAGLGRAFAIAADRDRAVKFTVNGKLVLSVVNPDAGATHEEIDATWPRHNSEFDIGFNGRFVADMLDRIDGDDVEFRMTDPGSPVRIADPGDASVVHVLMPMRV